MEDPATAPTKFPRPLTAAILLLCVLPFLANLAGFDFGIAEREGARLAAGLSPQEETDALHDRLRGSFTHTILEWMAFSAAIFTVVLAFVHFALKRGPLTPVLGLALFLAGTMDAFHVLAANRLIEAVADNDNLVPFTWALCRLFHALILIVGAGLVLLRAGRPRTGDLRFVLLVGAVFGVIAYAVIHASAVAERLPETPRRGVYREVPRKESATPRRVARRRRRRGRRHGRALKALTSAAEQAPVSSE